MVRCWGTCVLLSNLGLECYLIELRQDQATLFHCPLRANCDALERPQNATPHLSASPAD
jgi:hypothetical protein